MPRYLHVYTVQYIQSFSLKFHLATGDQRRIKNNNNVKQTDKQAKNTLTFMFKVCVIFSASNLVHNTVYDNDSETNENTGTLKPRIQ